MLNDAFSDCMYAGYRDESQAGKVFLPHTGTDDVCT